MSGPPLPPPRPKFPWDGPPEPPSGNCSACKPPDDEEERKKRAKEGKLEIKTDKPMSPNEMQQLGMEKGNEILRATPNLDYVDIKVTGVDAAGTQWTVTGGQTRAAMEAASKLGGRGVDAVGSGGAFKNISPFRAVGL